MYGDVAIEQQIASIPALRIPGSFEAAKLIGVCCVKGEDFSAAIVFANITSDVADGFSNETITATSSFLFQLCINFIRNLTNNFQEEIEFLDKEDSYIFNAALNTIINLLIIKGSIIPVMNLFSFINDYLNANVNSIACISPIIQNIVVSGLENYMEILNQVLRYASNNDISGFYEHFCTIFGIFIDTHISDFMNWGERDTLIKHSLFIFLNSQASDDLYFISELICQFIILNIIPNDVIGNLVSISFSRLNYDKVEYKYIYFDLLSASIKLNMPAFSDSFIISIWLQFINDGFIFRESERIRYIVAISLLKEKNKYPDDLIQHVEGTIQLLKNRQIPLNHKIPKWILKQQQFGIGKDIPFGFENYC